MLHNGLVPRAKRSASVFLLLPRVGSGSRNLTAIQHTATQHKHIIASCFLSLHSGLSGQSIWSVPGGSPCALPGRWSVVPVVVVCRACRFPSTLCPGQEVEVPPRSPMHTAARGPCPMHETYAMISSGYMSCMIHMISTPSPPAAAPRSTSRPRGTLSLARPSALQYRARVAFSPVATFAFARAAAPRQPPPPPTR